MSSKSIALSLRGLSKCYRVADPTARATTLAEQFSLWLKRPTLGRPRKEFWALKDVSLDIEQGQIVGLIGRNGAGKSTLLKVLSKITEPTSGYAQLYGNVGSLLEVGSGFHPELTGRENIFLSGSILGMRRNEIKKRFDEIVDFAGSESFLDTPVKRYSSGMYVRLAFAVASHLRSEILLVDEVLAVGDMDFQKKCFGKVREVSTDGRTVLLVSHNLQSIAALCTQAIVLKQGCLSFYGCADEAVSSYLSPSVAPRDELEATAETRAGSGDYRIERFSATRSIFGGAEPKEFDFVIRRHNKRFASIFICVAICDEMNVTVAQCDSRLTGSRFSGEDEIRGRLTVSSPWLKAGLYKVTVALGAGHEALDRCIDVCDFEVSPVVPYNCAVESTTAQYGIVLPEFSYTESSEPHHSLAISTNFTAGDAPERETCVRC